ncbi:DUF5397 family protein [Acidithiobacillus sp. MC6.1]|nr:DUF5397 family protein [Acidithiobacillus sp. MC6.1]
MQSTTHAFPHPELIGSFRQFGPFGVPYQIIKAGHQTEKGWTVEIEVPETGEHLDYPIDAVLNDPEAR